MEATALSVGKSVLDGALGYVKSAVAEEVALQLGIQRDHAFIRDELEMMRAFLMAAHEEGDEHTVVKTWVKQVRDVAYDAEDSLHDFAIRLRNPSWWHLPRTLLDRRRVAARMKELRARVEDVSQRNMRYQLIRGSGSKAATITEHFSTIMSGTKEAMWQRNKAKMDLIQLICNKNEEDLRVIAIWGTDSVAGETSVVKRAYDYLKRENKFGCHALTIITHPFNRVEFVQNIIRQFFIDSLREAAPGTDDLRRMGAMKEDDLIRAFQKYVNEKSFLIVLDDLSNNEEWSQIKECFPTNKKGSRLIVCTDKVEVGSLCVGKEHEIPAHRQLSTNPTLIAFYEKDSRDGINSMEPGPSSNLDITEDSGSTDEKRLTRMGTMNSAIKESRLIGRENEKSEIIKQVSDNSTQGFQVISIWGMGGLGKTTLIKEVYHSQELCKMFEKRACVTVKRPFNRVELLESLFTQLRHPRANPRERSLTDALEGKKYLVVLDDISSTAEWDAISHYFPKEVGSRIIVTTRVESIAYHCSKKEEDTHELKMLREKDACNLFTEKVFGKITDLDEQYPELAEVTKLILKKCDGLPLAIMTIAGFLSKRPKTVLEWRKVNEHIGIELEMNQELRIIKDILIKSYNGLPYHLKSCFLYMSIFPEGNKIGRRRLIRRWVAEGYSREIREKPAEEISDSYFMELIDRSMILPSKNSFGSRAGVDSCQLHDLMREVSTSKSSEENLVFRLEESCNSKTQEVVRHLTVSNNWTGDRSEFESAVDMSRIRSLTVFGEWRSFYISKKLRLLRVLDLESTIGLVNHHLEHVGSLLHLKYISLRGCDGIYHLPDSWGNLLQLETLDIKGTNIGMLPQTLIKLRNLQYLFGGKRGRSFIYDRRIRTAWRELCLACCASKYGHDVCTSWLHVIFPTLALRTLRQTGIVLPEGVRKLKKLRTLGVVNIARGNAMLREIRRLTQLRKLGVAEVNKENCQEFCSAVDDLYHLESLSVEPALGSSLHGLLDDVSKPPSNLRTLKVYGRLVKLPKWIGGLQNLVKLLLQKTDLSDVDTMRVLGKLPNLVILQLLQDSFNIKTGCCLNFCSVTSFPSLRVLELSLAHEGVLRAIRVEFEEGAAPSLELLRYTGAADTRFYGLATLRNLKEFEQDNNTYDFEEDVRDQLAKNPNGPNFKKLPLSSFRYLMKY